MRTSELFLSTAMLLCLSLPAAAQSEGGLVAGAEAEKKLSKEWSIGLEADLRTRNDFKTLDRWGFGLGASYKINKYLKADAGYKLLDYNFREKVSYKTSGDLNHWRPSYWGVKHRFHAGLTGSYKFSSGIKVSLRERWQYSYRPEKTVSRWDFDEETWEDKARAAKAKNQLRSRLEVSYDRKRALFTPFASVELYNAWSIEKIRYTVGADIRLTKRHTLEAFYRFQNMKNVDEDDYDPDMHFLGVGYKFKF